MPENYTWICRHIYDRLDYLKRMHGKLRQEDIEHEERVIRDLVLLIPNDASRRTYQGIVDEKLGGANGCRS